MARTLITGATGYIGRHLVARLVAGGERPRCLVRQGAGIAALPADRVELVRGDITDARTLAAAFAGVERVVHAAAVVANLKESKTVSYARINDSGTANVVRAAKEAGVGHLIHIGGINTVRGAAGSYIRTRWEGERHVKEGGVPYSILQPSILFGDGSAFFTALAGLAKLTPIVPVPGDGTLRFQPIWVQDVVSCIEALLGEGGRDETVAVGGPAYYSYDALLDLIFKTLGKRRVKLHLPMGFMKLNTALLQAVLPKPPATVATLELFDGGGDNITALDAVPKRFGFAPRSLEVELAEHGI